MAGGARAECWGRVLEKHKIKRVDRLLGNHRLSSERHANYGWIAGLVLGRCRHPAIIVDWSDIDTGKKLFLLRAAVSVGGRALPVYEEVHGRYHHRDDTTRFLHRLAELLPKGCKPIIVTDAGFKTPWFRTVEELGWYYVGRVRSRDYVRFPDTADWVPAKSLYAKAPSRPVAPFGRRPPRYAEDVEQGRTPEAWTVPRRAVVSHPRHWILPGNGGRMAANSRAGDTRTWMTTSHPPRSQSRFAPSPAHRAHPAQVISR